MKRLFIAILMGNIFFMLSILSAEVREKKSDDFLRLNDNIQNYELRAELDALRDEFNFERNRIHDDYHNKMEALKEARRNEMKTLKVDFTGRKEALKKKYVGKMRKKSPIQTTDPVKNTPRNPGKMKTSKDKKIIRKN